MLKFLSIKLTVFIVANNITEVRDAPDIEVTHDKVFSSKLDFYPLLPIDHILTRLLNYLLIAALENIDSQTKATQNATVTQTNTFTGKCTFYPISISC